MSESKTHTSTIVSVNEVADKTISIILTKPEGFDFTAGQFIEITLSGVQDERGNVRPFSIASAPNDNHMEIVTRVLESEYKKTLESLQGGSQIKFDGPFGNFVLHSDTSKPAVFLVGGIGITPVISVLRDEVSKQSSRLLALFYSNRNPAGTVYLPELTKMSESFDNINVVPTMTQAGSSKWSGETGYISSDMISKYVPDHKNSVFYIVGPTAFVDAMIDLLKQMDVDDLMIKNEAFSGY
ncbi:oxidoreductase [Candidatus Roizmanbacteria bacterium CG_4_10_14_0_2_um_filter_39_12]|nr:MAG: oxidoreductase [Candidatus Roizmanbacteria bacterium CG_4_10_14_0_2_um_filter_39_12]